MTVPSDNRRQRTTSRGRLYEWQPRTGPVERFWSVTTIIKGGVPAPAVAEWQAREIAEFAVANHRELAQRVAGVRLERIERKANRELADLVAKHLGQMRDDGTIADPFFLVSDPDAIAGAIAWLKGAPWRDKTRKADLGTAVHAELEAYTLDKPRPDPPLLVAPFVRSFRSFLEVMRPRIELAEAVVYSRTETYAGRTDVWLWINIAPVGMPDDWRLVVVDYKTGKAIYPDVALQLTAYARAEFVGLPDGSELPIGVPGGMPRPDLGAALLLRPAVLDDAGAVIPALSWEFIPVLTDDRVWDAFRYVREVFRWTEETSKEVLGLPMLSREALGFMAAGQPERPPAQLALVPPITEEGEV